MENPSINDTRFDLWKKLVRNTSVLDPVDMVAIPVFVPDGGSFDGSQSVTITSDTLGASIRYTIDGTEPTESHGTAYSSPVDVTESLTLKAIAYKSGMTDSLVKSADYDIALSPPMTNLIAWWKKGTDQIVSGGFLVSWEDQIQSSLIEKAPLAGSAPSSTLQGTVLFNGVDQSAKASFASSLNQPCTRYFRIRFPVLMMVSDNSYCIDGDSQNHGAVFYESHADFLKQFSGGYGGFSPTIPVNEWISLAVVTKGDGSSVAIDGVAGVTGNSGANNPGGLTLGSNGYGDSQFTNCEFGEVLIYNVAHTPEEQAAVLVYLDTVLPNE